MHTTPRKTILVVDDTPDNIMVLAAVLRDHYAVKVANRGEVALTVANQRDKPDLILLDLMMPGMDGYETCRRLKANPETSDIPVIFVTARTEGEAEEAGFEAGGVDYVTKPISAPILLARVRTHLALRDAVLAAREADRAKSLFLATMSHEIRTPLNGVMSMAELLEAAGLEDDRQVMARVIRQSSASLLRIINDILDFSKIEAGRMSVETVPFAPAALIEEVAALLAPAAESKGLTLTVAIDPALPDRAAGDPTRLRQVLLNLVGNAIKFTEAGSVAITAALTPAAPDDPLGGFRLSVSVADTGVGIAEDQRAGLFQPFAQADASTARRFGGTGLGLAISRRLSELMGGRIVLQSAPGVGSTFTIELPLAATEAEPERPAAALGQAWQAPDLATADEAGVTVLAVDDDEINRMVIERYLARFGYACELAPSAAAALALYRPGRHGLVLTDLHMPGMDGFELALALRAAGATVPLVALTADALEDTEEACRAAGMVGRLTKPIEAARLLATLERLLPGAAALRRPAGTSPLDETVAAGIDPAIFELHRITGPFGGWTSEAESFMIGFLDGLPQRLAGIAAALAEGEAGPAQAVAHALKGAARTVGAVRLGQMAADIEDCLASGDFESARSFAALLPEIEGELRGEISAFLARPGKHPAGKTSGT